MEKSIKIIKNLWIKSNNPSYILKRGVIYMKRLFDFNLKVWRKMKQNKLLTVALGVFVAFSIINSLLIYNFVQVLNRI